VAEWANEDYMLFRKYRGVDRIEVRLARSEAFIDYLEREEQRETDAYELAEGHRNRFASEASERFTVERQRIRRSANRGARRGMPQKEADDSQ
ncbi:MAG: hypothetical protein KIS73_30240, partial [Enhydrobacter sp.]|nr:hypothetical protein [Enhydrobacter sp.]